MTINNKKGGEGFKGGFLFGFFGHAGVDTQFFFFFKKMWNWSGDDISNFFVVMKTGGGGGGGVFY